MYTTAAPEILKALPPGTATYDKIINEGKEGVAIFIKESDEYINMWGIYPLVEVRLGMMNSGRIKACPMVINVNRNSELFYEMWINYHAELGKEAFDLLQSQESIMVFLSNQNNETRRLISISNDFNKAVICKMLESLTGSVPWSMEAFDNTKALLIDKYPSIEALWKAIKE